MHSPVRMTRALGADTTPPSAISNKHTTIDLAVGPEYKNLMGQLARMFPQLPENVQEQAREAHNHVQLLIRKRLFDQALGLMSNMRDLMKQLISVPKPPPFQQEEEFVSNMQPPEPRTARQNYGETSPSIPPLPPSTSPEIRALQRSVEDLHKKLYETSAVTLIAKRVRDLELEQNYRSLTSDLNQMKRSIVERLSSIRAFAENAEKLALVEAKKHTVSRNPFCEHEVDGFCEFCIGRDGIAPEVIMEAITESKANQPPMISGALKEDLLTKESVIRMQDSLSSYQESLDKLLARKRAELETLRNRSSRT
jgi:hypothetical protein